MKFKIVQPGLKFNSRETLWLIWNGVWNDGALHLYKNGEVRHPAHTIRSKVFHRGSIAEPLTDYELCSAKESAYYFCKEDAINCCQKYGYEYEVEDTSIHQQWKNKQNIKKYYELHGESCYDSDDLPR